MIDAILRVTSKSTSGGFTWHCIGPYTITLFDESSPPHLNQAIILVSPCLGWGSWLYTQNVVARWVAAVLATPYSEHVGQSVVDALLQIAHINFLRPHIPVDLWAWLKKRPPLPPVCQGRSLGTTSAVVRHIQRLEDVEILKSYFLLVWSEWDLLRHGSTAMMVAIKEEFSGIAMQHHREDLIARLDHVLWRLDQGLEHFKQHKPRINEGHIQYQKKQYGELKEALEEVEKKAVRALSVRIPPKLILFNECVNTDNDV